MEIKQATKKDIDIINSIVENTINEIYPKYLSDAIIKFFLELHSRENILKDIKNNNVWVFQFHGISFATATCINNIVKRLFVLPEFEGNGYGSAIMSFFEEKISEKYDNIQVDGISPSMNFYVNRGYHTVKNIPKNIGNENILYYERLKKDLIKEGEL
ncbi:MAG: GNAT family N-acetyltransferase [Methanobacteriaceae archaeon]|nr:GNAT family N-acetyltransferase [Methanobacteriaceae archaeon]